MLRRSRSATVVAALLAVACADAGSDPVALLADDPAPAAAAGGPYTAMPASAVRFNALDSHDATGRSNRLTFAWDFGDGEVGEGPTPQHAYAAPGRYNARVIVTDERGQHSTPATAFVTVHGLPSAEEEAVVVGAGDIAACGSRRHEATAALLDDIPGIVVALGDNVYNNGSASEYRDCYDPTWGRHFGRTRPAPGNHDYNTSGAAGYFGYFGSLAGDGTKGYYSYDVGAWHVVVLNSNIARDAGSTQLQWLRADLAAHPSACTLAYWHHPRFSSSDKHGNDTSVGAFWDALYDAGAEIVLAGHDHTYERFAPQTPAGKADPQRGIREFVVGTGGKDRYGFGRIQANSERRSSGADGVLKLALRPAGYGWDFVPAAGATFRDAGTGSCH